MTAPLPTPPAVAQYDQARRNAADALGFVRRYYAATPLTSILTFHEARIRALNFAAGHVMAGQYDEAFLWAFAADLLRERMHRVSTLESAVVKLRRAAA